MKRRDFFKGLAAASAVAMSGIDAPKVLASKGLSGFRESDWWIGPDLESGYGQVVKYIGPPAGSGRESTATMLDIYKWLEDQCRVDLDNN